MQDSTPTRFPEANLQTHFTKQVELTENSRSLSPLPHRHQNDFLMVTCKYALLPRYCLLLCGFFQSFPLFPPPEESLIADYLIYLTSIVRFSLQSICTECCQFLNSIILVLEKKKKRYFLNFQHGFFIAFRNMSDCQAIKENTAGILSF